MGRNERVARDERQSIVARRVDSLKPYSRNARTHSKQQIRQIAKSIERFGFTNPVLVTDDGDIIAGHGRVEAAKLLGMREVPTLALSHLSEAERRAYILADNKLALNAGWDRELLAIELQGLVDLSFELDLTGFSIAEIDTIIEEAKEADPEQDDADADLLPDLAATVVSRAGDLWELGRHRLLCGDARSARDFHTLLGDERVDLVFTDPPYNVKIDGNVCGLGGINSFGLGDTGRYRTNVWDYAGISSIGKGRAEELAMHPTVKPVAMIADAIRDCSRRGEIVLDCFAGSGSTLIAAEKTGRSARLIEYDPAYCDTIIKRWEAYTGKLVRHAVTGLTFEQQAEQAQLVQEEG